MSNTHPHKALTGTQTKILTPSENCKILFVWSLIVEQHCGKWEMHALKHKEGETNWCSERVDGNEATQ